MLTAGQQRTRYYWPDTNLAQQEDWTEDPATGALWREMPEAPESVATDSRWPAFFPSPICIVATGNGSETALEKVVGASIVNRFPYVVALSFCREELSARHYARSRFCELLERTGCATVQFFSPGAALDAVMGAIGNLPDDATGTRIAYAGLPTRPAVTNPAPVLEPAFMVYEARLVQPSRDYAGAALYERPWVDVGSHRIYFLRIEAIQLREDIADGRSQIHWRSLPAYAGGKPQRPTDPAARVATGRYQKGYTANYRFPARGTIPFQSQDSRDGMALRFVGDELVLDNDEARWPCFFPQSVGLITMRSASGAVNLMPCGSTTVVSRSPLVIAPCVSYAAINERYAPRASLDLIADSGWFGCGVPFADDSVVDAIRYAGNTSLRDDPAKLLNTGLHLEPGGRVPVLAGLPVFFECKVVGQARLGTHVMFLGEVRRIRVPAAASTPQAVEWCPWADVVEVTEEGAS